MNRDIGFPAIGATVRIADTGLNVWPEARKFFGHDCTLKAVFMTGDTQMIAVEHQEELVCCCFRADMLRTVGQARFEEREAAAKELYYTINWAASPNEWDSGNPARRDDYRKAIDAGYRKPKSPIEDMADLALGKKVQP